jgi:hypothetical protein
VVGLLIEANIVADMVAHGRRLSEVDLIECSAIGRLRQRSRGLFGKGVMVARVARGAVKPIEGGIGKDAEPQRLGLGGVFWVDLLYQAADGAQLRSCCDNRKPNNGESDPEFHGVREQWVAG